MIIVCNNKNVRRIAVIAPVGSLHCQPGVINSILCFADAGYEVDVFTIRNIYQPQVKLSSPLIKFKYFPFSINTPRESRLLATLFFTLWIPFVLRGQYTAIFAGGIRALLTAWMSSIFKKRKIINKQLELYVGPRLNMRFSKIFKWMEKKAVHSCYISLEHDDKRAEMLSKDLDVPREKIMIVPNSPCGIGSIQRSNFLHKKFDFEDESCILLSAGTLAPEFLIEELVIASQSLSEGWHCVIHSANALSENDSFVRIIKNANTNNRVYFSLDPVPYEKVIEVMSSAHIGLALYGEIGGPATTEVGLASGKLCHFLQLGIPVIVSNLPVLSKFVNKHKVGVAISDVNEIHNAIETIMMDYNGYCERASNTFTRELAFQTHFNKVIELLDRDTLKEQK